jgi:hypothetical protein
VSAQGSIDSTTRADPKHLPVTLTAEDKAALEADLKKVKKIYKALKKQLLEWTETFVKTNGREPSVEDKKSDKSIEPIFAQYFKVSAIHRAISPVNAIHRDVIIPVIAVRFQNTLKSFRLAWATPLEFPIVMLSTNFNYATLKACRNIKYDLNWYNIFDAITYKCCNRGPCTIFISNDSSRPLYFVNT